MKTVLITGPTRGLGLAIAQAFDARAAGVRLVLAVRDVAAGEAVARGFRNRPRVVPLDLASMDDVARFVASWREPLWGLINNAGVQHTGPASFTRDGFEETLAVNHLAPTWLTLGLLPLLRGGRVMGIGSGTHNPENRMATTFGFRGGRFTSIQSLARGEADAASDRQRGMDRYATSKLLVMATMMELARRWDATTFVTLDPGLMPGTGLARTAPWYHRLVWSTLLRWLVPVLPDSSTPARSAAAALRLLSERGVESGQVYDFEVRPSARVWAGAREPALGRMVLDQTIDLLRGQWPLAVLVDLEAAARAVA